MAIRRASIGAVTGALLASGLLVAAPPPASAAGESNGGTRVMAIGDSITDGWNIPGGYRIKLWDDLQADHYTVDFVGPFANGPDSLGDKDHAGRPGNRIDQIAYWTPPELVTYKPRTVLLHAGSNDLGTDDGPAAAPGRLSDLIDIIRAGAPDADIFVAQITPQWNPLYESRIEAFNAQIPGIVASKGSKVHLVDMHSALTMDDLADGVHPNAAGYAKMADVWYAALRSVPGSIGPSNSVVLSDDFEDGIADGWTTTGGTWTVDQPPGNTKQYHRTSWDENLSFRGSSSWTNYAVQAYVRLDSTDAGAGLLARMQANNKFYELELGRDPSSGVQVWSIWKNNGGSWTKLTSGSYSFDTSSYYLLRLTVNGNTLSAAISTNWGSSFNTLGSATDSTFSSGYIGLRPRGAGAAFDVVKVTLAS